MTYTTLIAGPYQTPAFEVGQIVTCQRYGAVEIVGITDNLIAWPYTLKPGGGGQRILILYSDLVKAVRCESAAAVSHWWGVSRSTVTRWRNCLGVGRMTEGTLRWWEDLAAVRLTHESRVRGGHATKTKAS